MPEESGNPRLEPLKPRVIKRRLIKQSDRQLYFRIPWQQLRFDLQSAASFPLARRPERNRRQVNLCWKILTEQRNLLPYWVEGTPVATSRDDGLIYQYLLNGNLRYIGKTGMSSILRRWKRRFQDSGITGYDYNIKRCLLNAAWQGSLKIKIQKVPARLLDETEAKMIRKHAPFNALWNRVHNERYFKESNFDI